MTLKRLENEFPRQPDSKRCSRVGPGTGEVGRVLLSEQVAAAASPLGGGTASWGEAARNLPGSTMQEKSEG